MGINLAGTILLSLAMGGCVGQDNHEDVAYYEGPATVYKIEILGLTNKKIELIAYGGVPTPCHYYLTTELSQENNDYYIKIYSRYEGEPCIAVISTIEVPVTINVQSGEKVFHFWQSDTTSLDTTITIY